MGLITQAIARAPRWVLKKLTSTYVTLHLSDIGRAIKIDSEDEVRALLLSMVFKMVSLLNSLFSGLILYFPIRPYQSHRSKPTI